MSIDSVSVHKMWDDNELSKMVKGGVPFPMLSDAGGKAGTVYGVYDEDAGVETRGRFIIDPEGVLQGYEVLTPPVGRNISESIRQVQAFQHVRNSMGTGATPFIQFLIAHLVFHAASPLLGRCTGLPYRVAIQ